MVFQSSRASADHLGRLWGSIGARVTGRRDLDVSGAWGGRPPHGWPIFVVIHRPAPEWEGKDAPFTFVQQARRAAGEKHVVGGTAIVRQCLEAGLLDEIHLDPASLLLGGGLRLFGHPGTGPVGLERLHVVEGAGVTHLGFRVLK